MIKPICSNFGKINFKQSIKNKDILNVIRENEIRRYEVKQAKINASYEFVEDKLVMTKSKNTDEYIAKSNEYQNWLNSEVGKVDKRGKNNGN